MRLLNISLLLLFPIIVSAQQTVKDAKITLNNGSIIYGDIVDASFIVKTNNGSTMTIQNKDIKSIEKNNQSESNSDFSGIVSIEAAKSYFKRYLISKKRDRLKVYRFNKTNGIKKKINGQDIYQMEYELTLYVKSSIYISPHINLSSNGFKTDFGYLKYKPKGYDALLQPNTFEINAGKKVKFIGVLYAERTENGWRIKSFKNKSYKTI